MRPWFVRSSLRPVGWDRSRSIWWDRLDAESRTSLPSNYIILASRMRTRCLTSRCSRCWKSTTRSSVRYPRNWGNCPWNARREPLRPPNYTSTPKRLRRRPRKAWKRSLTPLRSPSNCQKTWFRGYWSISWVSRTASCGDMSSMACPSR